jgi:hypothetical protein
MEADIVEAVVCILDNVMQQGADDGSGSQAEADFFLSAGNVIMKSALAKLQISMYYGSDPPSLCARPEFYDGLI